MHFVRYRLLEPYAGYIDACTLHTAHGRSLAFATGVKMANPELTIVNVMGDGDANRHRRQPLHPRLPPQHRHHRRSHEQQHLWHDRRARPPPTTPEGAFAATAPYGAIDPVFDVCKLAEGAGATFVARATVANPMQCEQILKKAIEHQKKASR